MPQQQFSKVEPSDQYHDNSSSSDSDAQPEYRDTESLLRGGAYSHPPSKSFSLFYAIIFTIIFAFSLLCSALFGVWASSKWQVMPIDKDAICAAHTNAYSPVVKDVDIKWDTIPFNGSLLKANEYRQPASPEVDAAWEALGVDYHAVRIPVSEGEASGLTGHVQIAEKHGGGYPANVEGLHQLHCLNLLRKALYYNFDYYHAMGRGPFANDEHILQLHVTHCLDIIRQQLMCQVDTGVLGQIWINPEEPEAYVDFNTRHTCKNYEAVREWAKERQLPEDVPEDFLKPPSEDQIWSDIP